jgi:ubiquinone/menaquinone biosynthesis C-methylase UbiE
MAARDYFKSTGYYYARYRSSYPEEFYAAIADRYHLDGQGRLLDLGCGTGQLAIPFASYFTEVVGMDPEPEMLVEAERLAGEQRMANIRWIAGSSDDLHPGLGVFRLTTIGTAFHWMRQDAVLLQLFDMTLPGGGVVIASSSSHAQGADFAGAAQRVIAQYLGEQRRAGSGIYTAPTERYEVVIARSPLRAGETLQFTQERRWTVDDIIGFYYSTSFASPYVLGDKREAYEADLRQALLALNPFGVFDTCDRYEAFVLYRDQQG